MRGEDGGGGGWVVLGGVEGEVGGEGGEEGAGGWERVGFKRGGLLGDVVEGPGLV